MYSYNTKFRIVYTQNIDDITITTIQSIQIFRTHAVHYKRVVIVFSLKYVISKQIFSCFKVSIAYLKFLIAYLSAYIIHFRIHIVQ